MAAPDPDSREDWRWITAEELRTTVSYLASDQLGGRGIGEPGIELAEEYIAAAFADAGLAPLPGRDDYFLPFSLYTRGFDADSTSLRISAGPFSLTGHAGATIRPFEFSDSGAVSGPLIFAGYGITAPEHGYDDYANLDVAGSVVLVMRHEPGELDPESPFDGDVHSQHAFFARKAENALRHGAVGMLVVNDPLHHEGPTDLRMDDPLFLDETEAAFATQSISSELPADRKVPFLAMQIDAALVDSLLRRSGVELAKVQSKIDAALRPVAVDLGELTVEMRVDREERVRLIQARNVAAILPGSDSTRAGEWIVVGAHHDHLGTFGAADDATSRTASGAASGRAGPPSSSGGAAIGGAPSGTAGDAVSEGPAGATSAAGDAGRANGGTKERMADTIFNGADDNASGTAAVLALARAFAKSPVRPARSIVFTTFSAEEHGLLGSYAMVGQNQIDTDRVVFLLNFDMIGRNPDRPVALTGDGFSRGLEEILQVANSGLEVPLGMGRTSMTGNTDHVAFAERDVPFLSFFTGTHRDYHELSDHASRLDFARMERIVRLAHGVVRRVDELDARLPFLTDLPWLGATVETAPDAEGGMLATIRKVEASSPAERALLRPGDVITAIGTSPLGNPPRISERFGEIPPGTSTSVAVRRTSSAEDPANASGVGDSHASSDQGSSDQAFSDQASLRTDATADAAPGETDGVDLVVEIERAHPGFLGVSPGRVPDDLRRSLGLLDGEGVLVRRIAPGGPAEKAGLQEGDVILAIAGRPVVPENLRGRLAQIGAKEKAELEFVRSGERRSVTLTLGSRRPS